MQVHATQGGDGPWRAAGFDVDSDGLVGLGGVGLSVAENSSEDDDDDDSTWWTWRHSALNESETSAVQAAVDGIATVLVDDSAYSAMHAHRPHANGADRIHSITLTTPDLHRTVGAFEDLGVLPQKTEVLSSKLSMAFFKLDAPGGPVVVEVVAPSAARLSAPATGPAIELPGFPPLSTDPANPARIVGMVLSVPSLDALRSVLGEAAVGKARPAIQGGGRMIMPLQASLGLPLTLAFMTPLTEPKTG